jgi:hypothetical protein
MSAATSGQLPCDAGLHGHGAARPPRELLEAWRRLAAWWLCEVRKSREA